MANPDDRADPLAADLEDLLDRTSQMLSRSASRRTTMSEMAEPPTGISPDSLMSQLNNSLRRTTSTLGIKVPSESGSLGPPTFHPRDADVSTPSLSRRPSAILPSRSLSRQFTPPRQPSRHPLEPTISLSPPSDASPFPDLPPAGPAFSPAPSSNVSGRRVSLAPSVSFVDRSRSISQRFDRSMSPGGSGASVSGTKPPEAAGGEGGGGQGLDRTLSRRSSGPLQRSSTFRSVPDSTSGGGEDGGRLTPVGRRPSTLARNRMRSMLQPEHLQTPELSRIRDELERSAQPLEPPASLFDASADRLLEHLAGWTELREKVVQSFTSSLEQRLDTVFAEALARLPLASTGGAGTQQVAPTPQAAAATAAHQSSPEHSPQQQQQQQQQPSAFHIPSEPTEAQPPHHLQQQQTASHLSQHQQQQQHQQLQYTSQQHQRQQPLRPQSQRSNHAPPSPAHTYTTDPTQYYPLHPAAHPPTSQVSSPAHPQPANYPSPRPQYPPPSPPNHLPPPDYHNMYTYPGTPTPTAHPATHHQQHTPYTSTTIHAHPDYAASPTDALMSPPRSHLHTTQPPQSPITPCTPSSPHIAVNEYQPSREYPRYPLYPVSSPYSQVSGQDPEMEASLAFLRQSGSHMSVSGNGLDITTTRPLTISISPTSSRPASAAAQPHSPGLMAH